MSHHFRSRRREEGRGLEGAGGVFSPSLLFFVFILPPASHQLDPFSASESLQQCLLWGVSDCLHVAVVIC